MSILILYFDISFIYFDICVIKGGYIKIYIILLIKLEIDKLYNHLYDDFLIIAISIKSIIIIAISSIIIGDTVFKYVPKSIILIKNYYIPFIALPMFLILLITFIRCLFLKKESKK